MPGNSFSAFVAQCDVFTRTHAYVMRSMPADDLRHLAGRRGVAAALGADNAIDDGHADAGEVGELHALQDVLARRMLRLVHQDEIGGAADLDGAAVELAHLRGSAGRQAEGPDAGPRWMELTANLFAYFETLMLLSQA